MKRLVAVACVAWLLGVVVADYAHYRAPVTQDRFGHRYLSDHARARVVAYARLFESRVLRGRRGLERAGIEAFVDACAPELGIEPALAKAVSWFESGYRADHISTTGAMGLMALMPETAALHGVADPFDPYENLRGGMRFLRHLLERFPDDPWLAVAAYNAGPVAVEQHGGVPPYPETRDYVRSVRILHAGLVAEAASRMPPPGGGKGPGGGADEPAPQPRGCEPP